MDQKTAEGFQDYDALFQDAIEDGTIGLCIWDRSGDTVDTALPGIREMIEGVDDWQAVVIDSDCPDEVDDMSHAKGNPFDFEAVGNKEAGMGSTIPIIRLSNILGGLPHPELSFIPETTIDRNKREHIVYLPSDGNQKNIDEYDKLSKMYDFDGIRPYQILLVSTLLIPEEEMDTDTAWHRNARESQSSEFWRRNGYSSSSRFLKYEYDCTGSLNRARQKLKFWLSVLLLSINNIDPSALQAYRLYKIDVQMDGQKLKQDFQEEINQLVAAKHVMEKKIKQLSDDTLAAPGKIPEFKTEVELAPDNENDIQAEPSSRISYGLFGGDTNREIDRWDSYCNSREDYYKAKAKSIDRKLDMTAYSTKRLMKNRTSDVEPLNKYQREDIRNTADSYLNTILKEQGALPDLYNLDSEGIKKAKQNVTMDLRKRLKSMPVFLCAGAAILFFLISFMPDFVIRHMNDLTKVSIYSVLCIVSVIAAVVCTMFYFKGQLKVLIDKYKNLIQAALNSLEENKDTYADYINDIASYSRSKSYIKAEALKHQEDMETCDSLRFVIHKVDEQRDKLMIWSKAFGLSLDGSYDAIEGNAMEKKGVPDRKDLFKLKYVKDNQVELNRSGEMISSPFIFVKRLEVYREELYEARN